MSNAVNFEEYIHQNGSLTYTNVGVSMLPLLRQGKDLLIVSKRNGERCKVGDVVLYKRPSNQYVLHRVVEVRKDDYVILGDNCIHKEYGIEDKDIIAVMTGFVRNGKEHGVSEKGYRMYSLIWLKTTAVRIAVKKTKHKIGRLIQKMKLKNEQNRV